MADTQRWGRPGRAVTTGTAHAARSPLVRLRKWLGGSYAPYFYVAPFFVVFFAFFAYPVAYSFYVSLQHWSGVGPMRSVGLGNYTFVLSDSLWWDAVKTTGLLWLLVIPPGMLLSLIIAVVWNRPRFRGRNAALVMYILPTVVSIVAASEIFRILYDPTSGPINVVLSGLHLPTIPFLTNVPWARVGLALVRLWESVGLGALFFSAALQNISPELFEAAMVDGCGPVRQFFSITLPLLAGTVLFLTVVGTLYIFSLFAEPQLIMSNGGPDNGTVTVGLYLFQMMQGLDFGTASAVSFLMTLLMMVISIALFVGARRWTRA